MHDPHDPDLNPRDPSLLSTVEMVIATAVAVVFTLSLIAMEEVTERIDRRIKARRVAP